MRLSFIATFFTLAAGFSSVFAVPNLRQRELVYRQAPQELTTRELNNYLLSARDENPTIFAREFDGSLQAREPEYSDLQARSKASKAIGKGLKKAGQVFNKIQDGVIHFAEKQKGVVGVVAHVAAGAVKIGKKVLGGVVKGFKKLGSKIAGLFHHHHHKKNNKRSVDEPVQFAKRDYSELLERDDDFVLSAREDLVSRSDSLYPRERRSVKRRLGYIY
ncbi:hypothetical protein ABKN59_006674 [Abortiporus biennis]